MISVSSATSTPTATPFEKTFDWNLSSNASSNSACPVSSNPTLNNISSIGSINSLPNISPKSPQNDTESPKKIHTLNTINRSSPVNNYNYSLSLNLNNSLNNPLTTTRKLKQLQRNNSTNSIHTIHDVCNIPNFNNNANFTNNVAQKPHNNLLKYKLHPNTKTITISQLATYLDQKNLIYTDLNSLKILSNLLILDTRSFNDYSNSRIKNSLNFSLPTTLLKRPNFNLKRSIDSLGNYEKSIFDYFLNNDIINNNSIELNSNSKLPKGPTGLPCVILYDSNSIISLTSKNNDNTNNKNNNENSPLTSSLTLSCMSLKFLNKNAWNAPVFVLQGGFTSFTKNFPNLIDKSPLNQLISNPSSIPTNFTHNLNPSNNNNKIKNFFNFNNINNKKLNKPNNIKNNNNLNLNLNLNLNCNVQNKNSSFPNTLIYKSNKISPALSGFKLPPSSCQPTFKIRQNEEPCQNFNLFNEINNNKINQINSINNNNNGFFDLDSIQNINSDYFKLLNYDLIKKNSIPLNIFPIWLSNLLSKNSIQISNNLTNCFDQLEYNEKIRLNNALSLDNNKNPNDKDCLQISSGLELGSKNRYKDIIPYENTRVKLSNAKNDSDYINASYLSSFFSQNKYIATQGPLSTTIADFWEMIINHKSPLIISLTSQFEDNREKCSNYWKNATYSDNGTLKVHLIEEINVSDLINDQNFTENFITNNNDNDHNDITNFIKNSSIIIRRIQVQLDDSPEHQVLQLQVESWPDYGTFDKYDDLLTLIYFERLITTNYSNLTNENPPIVVHCSAGCGRTGTFCTIDSTIDYIINHPNNDNTNNDNTTTTNNNNNTNNDDRKNGTNITSNTNTSNTDTSTNNPPNSNHDPVFDIVDLFRNQRVSMVQTLKQYLLIYDTLIVYYSYKNSHKLEIFDNIAKKLEIFQKYFKKIDNISKKVSTSN
ncbi:uncharacterized protein ASCRUDRAFT_84165 [Ascoidea rubescens DSM 1968]|uniref:protein-tyrosine-phosphatase n=1 Tax=Ascoidea rubescens DSM 1968 TaxID=1344418 RepID=A0A1D2VRW7_9ASCO|nr:hypothetical protein ASCRUDRAFT_84165 [Ascoidea rubescens DSM 1968]ODV64346.1 hypothetical protein ASCRUDRAFT_84165 [Ascoidea rubescens DSM 1968]